MVKKKVNLKLVANENSRAISFKKRRLGLVKKVRELTILCDVNACLIMFSPNEAEPMVWPSVEVARGLIDKLYALPEYERKKKETTLESYLKDNIGKFHEKLRKIQKKNMEIAIDQLMMQLSGGRGIDDLNLNEINSLLSFSKDEIMHLRKRLDFEQHPPLRDPPVNPFEVQSKEPKTTTNDVFMIEGGQEDERAKQIDEGMQRIRFGTAIRENQNHYLVDQWFFPSSEAPNPQIHQNFMMGMEPYKENPNHGCYLPYQGSSSNGNSNLEMEPMIPPVMTFHGLLGSVSQPLQHHHNMNNDQPIVALNQPRQYPYNFTRFEERSNINNGDFQFHRNSNTMTTNDGLRHEPPPPNEETVEEGNIGTNVTLFGINMDWSGINNHRF